MTKQDAIEAIRMAIAQVEWEYPMDYAAAFDMAVEALSQPEIIRCKECRYGEPMCKPWDDVVCTQNRATHCPDWFCADGKHRDD